MSAQGCFTFSNLFSTAADRKGGVRSTLQGDCFLRYVEEPDRQRFQDFISAAAALQSRGAFDVRWCRGDVGARIFDPMRAALEAAAARLHADKPNGVAAASRFAGLAGDIILWRCARAAGAALAASAASRAAVAARSADRKAAPVTFAA